MLDRSPSRQVPVEPDDYRDFMSRFPTGVAVVTATDRAGIPWGCTCSSLCGVSLRPPVLSVCLTPSSRTLAAARESGRLCVHVMGAGAQAVAEVFAAGGDRKTEAVRFLADGASGLPEIGGAIALAACTLAGTHEMGDHVVVFGTVMSVQCRAGPPLLHGLREYAAWPGPPAGP
jgi:flavin reductase (DIM6/NTAB) family NADH-FMN oxidoreductase RutF